MCGKGHYNGAENELKLLMEHEHFLYHYTACCLKKKKIVKGHYNGTENALKLLRGANIFCTTIVLLRQKCVEKITIMGPKTN